MSSANALILISALAASQPAIAQGPFDARPVDNAALAAERGSYRPPESLLTVGKLRSIGDDTARADFRSTGSIGTTIMDDWWSTDGALLIDMSRGSIG